MSSEDGDNLPLTREDSEDCAICMQPCLQPVKFPCDHIFCFLCAKGIASQSRCCALCRAPIPHDFIRNPNNFKHGSKHEKKGEEQSSEDDRYVWFYQGYQGWWQYDERSSAEMEQAYQNQHTSIQILIAGNLYHIDLVNMQQYQANRASRKRAIKRDKVAVQKKGVAGMTDDSNTPSTSSCAPQQPQVVNFTQQTNPSQCIPVVELTRSTVRPVVDLSQSNVRPVIAVARLNAMAQSNQPLDLSISRVPRSNLSNQPDVVTSTLRMMPVGAAIDNILPSSGASQEVETEYVSDSSEDVMDTDVPITRSLSSNINVHRSHDNEPRMLRSNTTK